MNFKKLAVLIGLASIIVIGSAAGKVAVAATLTVDDDLVQCPAATFTSIGAAVAVASPGDTIKVCAGTYNEVVQVDRTLIILGAQSSVDARTRAVPVSSESVVGSGDGAFQILANNVVIDGFTIQGVNNPPNVFPNALGAGIWTNPGFTGTNGGHQIRNNIIQNNIVGIYVNNDGTLATKVDHNRIQNNNNPGPANGTGIYSDLGLIKATIDSNKFVGNTVESAIDVFGGSNITFSGNEFDSNRRAIGLGSVTSSSIIANNIHNSTDVATADIRMFGGVSGLSITCNSLTNGAGRGIRMDDECPGCPNSSININNNNISGYPVAGLQVDSGGYSGGSLNATNNWWGSSTGPTIASNPGGTGEPIIDPDNAVNFTPFRATLSSCAPVTQIGPPTNKDQCKNDGWKLFNTPRTFKNQGDCIQYVNTGK
jgi:hypothetical protein